MLIVLISLGFLVLVVWMILNAIVKIPAYHFGVLERFGERTGVIYYEGLGIKIPFIDEVELVSLELEELNVEVEFTTNDKLQLNVKGSLQYRPDPKIVDENKRNVFVTMSEEIIRSGIEDNIQAILGGLGGVYQSSDFISSRPALADLLNSIFRLSTPPHLQHDVAQCNIINCEFEKTIDAKMLIGFYNLHWKIVKEILGKEKKTPEDRSSTEIRYGIDIETFTLSHVNFSEVTKQAFEKEKQAEARQKAFRFKLEMAKEAKRLGASPQEAFNAADVSLDPSVKKTVVSVEGRAGVLGGLIDNFGKNSFGKKGD